MKSILFISSLFVSSLAIFGQTPAVAGFLSTIGVFADDEFSSQQMLDQINAMRAKGCNCPDGIYYGPAPALTWNDKLASAAERHAKDMNSKSYFSHIGKDGSNFTDRVSRMGYDWQLVAENIAMGHRSTAEVVRAWSKSNGHCQNLMNPNFTEMGAARSGAYWVQELGARP